MGREEGGGGERGGEKKREEVVVKGGEGAVGGEGVASTVYDPSIFSIGFPCWYSLMVMLVNCSAAAEMKRLLARSDCSRAPRQEGVWQ